MNNLSKSSLSPFHLAIPVHDLNICRIFYRDVLGLSEGRSSDQWVDFNFHGHQLVIHETGEKTRELNHNAVDGHAVPIPHFGIVLDWELFHSFATTLKEKNVTFVIEPYIRFEGEVGEQATMFFYDPSGNALEFKSFRDMNQLFAS